MDLTQELGPRVKTVLGFVFAMAFAIPGAIVAYLGAESLYEGYVSQGWPTVEGEVIRSGVNASRGGIRSPQRVYSPDVVYSYRVGNGMYTGDRVSFGDYSDSGQRYADNVVSRYPGGRMVSVHYAPGNPDNAVLEPGVHTRTWFKPLFGLVFLVVGLGMARFFYRRGKRSS